MGWGRNKQDAAGDDAAASATEAVPASARSGGIAGWWDNMPAQKRRTIFRLYLIAMLLVAAGGGVVYAMQVMEDRIYNGQSGPLKTSMHVTFASVPDWMPASLYKQLIASLKPADVNPADPDLPAKVGQLAQQSPWIKKVRISAMKAHQDPAVAWVEVDVEFRRPLARVLPLGSNQPHYVDADGVRLPADGVYTCFVSMAGAAGQPPRLYYFVKPSDVPAGYQVLGMHYLTIEGVEAPPPDHGRRWEGQDLQAGLEVMKWLHRKTYANQIAAIDVRNFAGRVHGNQSNIVLRAQLPGKRATLIKFGRLAEDVDYELQTKWKMHHLDTFVTEFGGRLAGTVEYVVINEPKLAFAPYGD